MIIHISVLDVDKLLLHIGKKRHHIHKAPCIPAFCSDSQKELKEEIEPSKDKSSASIYTPTFWEASLQEGDEKLNESIEDISDEAYNKRHEPFEKEEKAYYGGTDEYSYACEGGIHSNTLKIILDKDKNPLMAC